MNDKPKELIIPFGKYKGQPAERLRENGWYAEWLVQQPWFKRNFPELFDFVISGFQETEDSPEHNQLQARFLDNEFVYRVMRCADRRVRSQSWFNSLDLAERLAEKRGHNFDCAMKVRFEYRGWDVFASIDWGVVQGEDLAANWPGDADGYMEFGHLRALCEIKPTLDENYPAVLRAMQRLRGDYSDAHYHTDVYYDAFTMYVLLAEDFLVKSVSLDQVREIFARECIVLLLLSDIEAGISVPSWAALKRHRAEGNKADTSSATESTGG